MNRTALTRWWQGLAPRERTVLVAGAFVIALILVYVLLWEPPVAGIRKLEVDLPLLHAQNASMQAMADEAVRLRAAAGRAQPIAPGERVAAVRRSLQRAGLASASGSPVAAPTAGTATGDPAIPVRTLSVNGAVTTLAATTPSRTTPPEVVGDGERVRVRFDDIDYGVWVAWLANAETELSARAVRVAVATTAPKSPVGHVRAEASLDWTPVAAASSAASSPAPSMPSTAASQP